MENKIEGLVRIEKATISVFIVAYFLTVFVTSLPTHSQLAKLFVSWVGPLWSAAALNQNWRMFAPNPPRTNDYFTASVHFLDGHSETWTVPYFDPKLFHEGLSKEHFRKWSNDGLMREKMSWIWPDAAKYIVRSYYPRSRLIDRITFVKHVALISVGQAKLEWTEQRFYSYTVKARIYHDPAKAFGSVE